MSDESAKRVRWVRIGDAAEARDLLGYADWGSFWEAVATRHDLKAEKDDPEQSGWDIYQRKAVNP
jgi:hypothetical protein